MIAVIKTGGKQYKVSENSRIKVEKLDIEPGNDYVFEDVLLVSNDDGSDVKVGTPTVSGAKVTAKVVAQDKAKKIDVVKYKAKVRYFKRQGHRQPYTELEVTNISA